MVNCPRCGIQLPEDEDLRFCPNCGLRISRKPSIEDHSVTRILTAGLFGAFLSVMINSLSPMGNLYFLPSFLSSIFIIYLYKVNNIKEALAIAFAIYLFADGVIAALILGYCYFNHEPYSKMIEGWIPELWEVLLYTLNPVSAFLAGYIGARLTSRAKEVTTRIPERRGGPGGVIYSS